VLRAIARTRPSIRAGKVARAGIEGGEAPRAASRAASDKKVQVRAGQINRAHDLRIVEGQRAPTQPPASDGGGAPASGSGEAVVSGGGSGAMHSFVLAL
jgi:hypothetical protein